MNPIYLTLNEAFDAWDSGEGIFSVLQTITNLPWLQNGAGQTIDMDYYGNYSGQKVTAPLVDRMYEKSKHLSRSDIVLLANVILSQYGESWKKIYNTYELTYDPISNYDMTESLSDTTTDTYGRKIDRTNQVTLNSEGQITNTPELKTVTKPAQSDTSNQSIAAFNSTSLVDVAKNTQTQSGTITTDNTGTDKTSNTNTSLESGNTNDTYSGSDKRQLTHTLSRKGNIGVTTSQQMIQAERDLWLWNFIRTCVYPDVDKILTCPIY